MDTDLEIRTAAFNWLREQVEIHGDVLPRELLQKGLIYQGKRIPLVSPQGIFKPRLLDLPLTIATTPDSPYEDAFTPSGYLRYSYRGTDPAHRDNAGLRELMRRQKPLIYFHGILPGRYLAVWPVFIIGDNPRELTFTAAVEDLSALDTVGNELVLAEQKNEGRRAYLTATTKVRLHQRTFREKVLAAYLSQCAFCRLRHRELLDAAHIVPDHEPEGRPTVNNGLALCKLHHAAYDSFILSVTPDYIIRVREDILEEIDGPLLQVGLKEMDGLRLNLPTRKSDWPSRQALEWKYQRFQTAI